MQYLASKADVTANLIIRDDFIPAEDGTLYLKPRNRFFAWLAKLLGAKPIITSGFTPIGEVRLDDVVTLISTQKTIVESIVRASPRTIVIGLDQLRALKMRTAYGTFSFPSDYTGKSSTIIDRYFSGMQIVTCPWINGVVVLPNYESPDDPEPSTVVGALREF